MSKLPKLNSQKVKDEIYLFIQDKVSKSHSEGIVIGLSGGIDSTVSAFLATETIGRENIFGIHMFSSTTPKEDTDHARLIAKILESNSVTKRLLAKEYIKNNDTKKVIQNKTINKVGTSRKIIKNFNNNIDTFKKVAKESIYLSSTKRINTIGVITDTDTEKSVITSINLYVDVNRMVRNKEASTTLFTNFVLRKGLLYEIDNHYEEVNYEL